MTLAYAVKVYVDTLNDGAFGDALDDISAYFISASGARGRSDVNGEYVPSKAKIVLNNASGDLSLFRASAAYYGKIRAKRALKILIEIASVEYPLYYGFIKGLSENRQVGDLNQLEIECEGLFGILQRGTVRINLLETKRVDELVGLVLDEIRVWSLPWPVGMRDFDTAYETIDKFWQHRAKPISALREAAKQELSAHLFEGKNGDVIWRNRWWRATQSLAATIGPSGDLKGRAFSIDIDGSDLIDSVEYTRAGLDLDPNVTVLYTFSPTGREFLPGNNAAVNTINGQYSVGGKNVVTPVANTDYVFNSVADGSGTDKTAQVTVDSFTSYGGGFSLLFNVLDSSPVYLQSLGVRGQAVRRSNDERLITVTADNPPGTDEVLQDEFSFNDNVSNITAMARLKANTLSIMQPKPPVLVTPEDNTQLLLCVNGLDIGSKVRLIDIAGPQYSDIDDYFMIEQYTWKLAPKKLPQFTFSLWHVDQANGNLFRISPDSPADILSPITTDAATSGYDRIGV